MFSGNYKLYEDRVGGVSRDLDKDKPDEYFYPVDNMQVLSNKVRLKMGNNKTYFLTDCKVQCPSGEILQFKIGENPYIEFETKDPGEYIWAYDILIDDEEYAFRMCFSCLKPKFMAKFAKQYLQFLKAFVFRMNPLTNLHLNGCLVTTTITSKNILFFICEFAELGLIFEE